METLFQDLHYAQRHLRRSPGFAIAAVLTLALGIGANTAMFTVLNALLLKPLPIKDPDGLVGIISRTSRGVQRPNPLMGVPLLAQNGPLQDVCGYNGGAVIGAEVNGVPTQTVVAFVTGNCFTTFGVMPVLGRPIVDDDAPLATAGAKVAVISHRFWTRMFNADRGAIGRTVRLEGVQMEVVGVTPEGFGGLNVDTGIDVFAPPDTIIPATRERRPVATQILGRLRPGVTLEQASAQIASLWPAVLATAPTAATLEGADLYGIVPEVAPIGNGISQYRTQYGRPLTLILGLTSTLLVLACINLGGLLLPRLLTRRTELAVRLALGGGRWRIAQQMLLEGLILSLTGAALALPLSSLFVAPLVSFIPPGLVERTLTFAPDWRVLSITAIVGLTVGLLMTALPLWVAMRRHAVGQFTSHRTVVGTTNYATRALLVAQVALSVVLLVGAGLLVRSLYLLQQRDLGVRTDGVLYARLMPVPGSGRATDQETYYPALLEQLRALPGVRAAEMARVFPRATTAPTTPIAFVGEEHGEVRAHLESVSPGFFEALGIPLHSGRRLEWSDGPKTRSVALLSESLARALAADGNAINRRVRFGTLRDFQDLIVVGVVGNSTIGNPRVTSPPILYVSSLQMGRSAASMGLLVSVDGNRSTVASGIRQAVREAGREYVHELVALDEVFARAPASERMSATLAAAVGLLAVVLTVIGIHGALAYSVSRRTREIGVRVAIGATPRAAATRVLREALTVTAIGVAIGVPLAVFAARMLRTLLFGISETDTITLAGTAVFFLLLGALAAVLPARRAARVDPMIALRTE